jgi:tRNA pseudouridine synthase 10
MSDVVERAAKVLEKNCCDHCLGRQFSQLLSGHTNESRGRCLRSVIATEIDAGKAFEKVNPNNFAGFTFRQNKDFEKLAKEKRVCDVCNGLFDNLDNLAKKVAKKLKPIDFSTFLVGTKPSRDILEREEALWTIAGIDYCEPLRAELNREVGKRVEKLIGKHVDLKKPDITVILDLEGNKIQININPLFIFGYYKKVKRGFPQCRWGTPGHYKTSVEEEVGRPLLKLAAAKDHKFHGAGREDIDALCLDWRAFVIEAERPKNRHIDLKKLAKLVAKGRKVQISNLKYCDMEAVRRIKAARPDKTYRALVVLEKPVKPAALKKLNALKGHINQQTPERVLHRRADLSRKREVLAISWKRKNAKQFDLIVKGSAGLYIKELVSGDNGRTKPSVSEILGVPAKVKELDVIKIGRI